MRLNPDFFEDPEQDPEPKTDKIEHISSFKDLPEKDFQDLKEGAKELEDLLAEVMSLGFDREQSLMFVLSFKAQQIQTLQKSMVRVQEAILTLRDGLVNTNENLENLVDANDLERPF
jgi:hypothetical protein